MSTPQRTLTVSILTLALFGGMIEAMKSSRDSGSILAHRKAGIFGWSDVESDSPILSKRFDREAADRARSRLSGRIGNAAELEAHEEGQRVGGLSEGPAPATTTSSSAEEPANLGDSKKIKMANAAPKKSEGEKKKKKKKKKKSDIAAGPSVEVQVTERDQKTKESHTETNGAGVFNIRNATAITAKETSTKNREAAEEKLSSLEEWLAFIMPQPSYDRTMKMLQELQSKRLETSIFHEVAAEMLSDPRPKMQELGVLALGSFPSLRSYLLLQSSNARFSETSPLRIQSRNFLKNYTRLENLRYLSSVLTTRVESDIVFEALRLIHTSASFYSDQAKTSAGEDSESSLQPARVQANNHLIRQFGPLVPVLNRLAQTSTDEAIRQQASTTLQQVQFITGASS
jgi:hypothetical protein